MCFFSKKLFFGRVTTSAYRKFLSPERDNMTQLEIESILAESSKQFEKKDEDRLTILWNLVKKLKSSSKDLKDEFFWSGILLQLGNWLKNNQKDAL